jgi:hypothetical protein
LQSEKTLKTPCFINEKNEVLVTNDEKRDTIYDHFDNVFNCIESVLGLVPDWLEKRWIFAALDMLPSLDASILREVALKISKRKTSAADGIVIEMLLACDDTVFDVLSQNFLLRILNHETEDSENAWEDRVVNLIGKKKQINMPRI